MKISKMVSSSVVLLLLLVNSVSFAATNTMHGSNIPLGIIQILPGDSFKLVLSKLYDGIHYNLSCNVQYTNDPTAIDYSYLQIFCPTNSDVRLSSIGNKCVSAGNTMGFKGGDTLYISNIQKAHNVTIRNLDYSEPVLLTCEGKVAI